MKRQQCKVFLWCQNRLYLPASDNMAVASISLLSSCRQFHIAVASNTHLASVAQPRLLAQGLIVANPLTTWASEATPATHSLF